MYKKEIFLEIDANLHQPIQSMEADSNSRSIRFYLTSNYIPFKLTGKKVIFKAVKPDGTDIVNDCQIIDAEKGIVEIEVTKQLNAVPGKVKCQLSILGENDYVLKTKKFIISVDSKLNESGVISSKEYKTLENALSQVHEINKNFEQVNTKIDEVATKGTTIEVIESATKKEIDRQIADGTLAHLMIEDGGVTPEKTSFYSEIESHNKVLKNAGIDYTGAKHNSIKKAMDANVDWLLGKVNTTHYEGQHITATDTIEGHAKSAILKGNTLINLFEETSGDTTVDINYVFFKIVGNQFITLKPNTQYTLMFDKYIEGVSTIVYQTHNTPLTIEGYQYGQKFTFTTLNDVGNAFHVFIKGDTLEIAQQMLNLQPKILIIEGDHSSEDIPYFEGMQSVKMPVLTTSNEDGAKTNILIVNEELTLRSKGEVYDELDLLTGRLTQRIDENNEVLAQEVVKTVDLSDNVVYSYDEVTHYDCSSEEGSLVPTLSVDAPTNLSALVSRQRATIETQKEQIQTLEIENEQLIAQNEIQDEDIALNQDAINFMLFASEMSADENNKTKGVNTMAAYLANQILKGKLD